MAQRVQVSEFGYLYGQTLRQTAKGALWIPLVIHGLLLLIVALMHYHIFSPVTGSVIRAWANLVNADYAGAFFHYPAHFGLMPYFFGQAQMLLNILVEAFLFGIVIDMFIALYRGQKPAFMQSVGNAFRRYLQLTLVWFVVIGVLYLLNSHFFDLVENVFGYSLRAAPRRQTAAEFGLRGLTILIYAVCIFLLPSIMAGGVSFRRRISRGFGTALRHPFIAIGLVLIPYLIGFIPSWALSHSDKIVSNFSPELVFYLILISIGLDVIINFILLGTVVKFFMDQTQ